MPFAAVLFFAACSATGPSRTPLSPYSTPVDEELGFKINPDVPLGSVEGSGANPDAVGMTQYGLAKNVKQKWNFVDADAAGANVVFSDKTNEIYWFAQFGFKGSVLNNVSRTFRIKWYSPNGRLYHEAVFKSGLINETFIKTVLKLNPPLEDGLIGRWRVRVWKKDMLIDDRYFEIVRT